MSTWARTIISVYPPERSGGYFYDGVWPTGFRLRNRLAHQTSSLKFIGGVVAKRFTETEKWRDPWFCALSERDRLFWLYLCDNCSHAGIWQVNQMIVNFYFNGYELHPETFGDRIEVLSSEKWFLTKFCEFQYKKNLNPKNRVHSSVLRSLQEEGASKGLARGLLGAKDSVEVGVDLGVGVEVDVRGGVGGGKEKKFNLTGLFESLWEAYPRKKGKEKAKQAFSISVKTDENVSQIKQALQNYLGSRRVAQGFIKDGERWFREWRQWIDFKDEENDPRRTKNLDFA